MLNLGKYQKHLLLGLLTMAVVMAPTLTEAVVSNQSNQRVQIAQNQVDPRVTDDAEIRRAVLSNEQKYHWQPQVNILAVADGYAITSVHDQNTGGESVLQKQQGDWKVICGSGGAFGKAVELAQQCKVPIDTANKLLQTAQRGYKESRQSGQALRVRSPLRRETRLQG